MNALEAPNDRLKNTGTETESQVDDAKALGRLLVDKCELHVLGNRSKSAQNNPPSVLNVGPIVTVQISI